jgi:hypothetical protein
MSKSNETPQSSNAKNEQKYHSQDYYQAIKQAFKETTYVVAHESRFDIKKRKAQLAPGFPTSGLILQLSPPCFSR